MNFTEVLMAIANDSGISHAKMESYRLDKRESHGGFDNMVYLDRVETKK